MERSSFTLEYYFIVYKWTRKGMSGWITSNMVTKKHPLAWLKEALTEYEDTYRIEYYTEISKYHYDMLNGYID